MATVTVLRKRNGCENEAQLLQQVFYACLPGAAGMFNGTTQPLPAAARMAAHSARDALDLPLFGARRSFRGLRASESRIKSVLENPGFDPGTSRMLNGRSTN